MTKASTKAKQNDTAEPAATVSKIDPAGHYWTDPVVLAIEPSNQPPPECICIHCPVAVWFSTPFEVKCYCNAVHVISWSTTEQIPIDRCSAQIVAVDAAITAALERAAKLEKKAERDLIRSMKTPRKAKA